MQLLARRVFTLHDQYWFANASGDRNPLHLDPIAARRTIAGEVAVHGMHLVLWALDCCYAQGGVTHVVSLKVKFQRFVPLNQEVELWMKREPESLRLEIRSDGARLVTIIARDECPRERKYSDVIVDTPPMGPLAVPRDLDLSACSSARGRFHMISGNRTYSRVATALGKDRVDALTALSYLVGMVVPGLHSVFSAFEICFTNSSGRENLISYEVVHELSNVLTIRVTGPGLTGEIQAILRPSPVAQPPMSELVQLVSSDAFSGISAIVVGGSRGLGELTAKLLAAGGARVALSYSTGHKEAEAVAADIRTSGHECTIFRFDARMDPELQLAHAAFSPDHVYYFATSKIFGSRAALFSSQVYSEFASIYVDAFYRLCGALSQSRTRELCVFYPSSVAVSDRPRGMTEYAMAKAAGEVLCADIDRYMPHVRTLIRRLPRLMTDQTATIAADPAEPATQVILEAIESMMRLTEGFCVG